MSGPKVVRVRTREERVAECLSAIDNLRAAVEQCERFAQCHDYDDADRIRERSALLDELESRAHAGSFNAVLRTCGQTLAEVNFEREELERKVLERAASEATRRRRTTLLAQGLARRLESKGLPIPGEISMTLNLSSSDPHIEDAERLVNQLLSQHLDSAAESAPRGPTEAQRKLAETLVTDSRTETLTEWVAHQTAETSGTARERLERLIAEVNSLNPSDAGRQLIHRARAARAETDAGIQTRKIDSLLLEWATRRREIAATHQLTLNARRVELALQRVNQDDARVLEQRIRIAATSSGTSLETAIAQAEAYLLSHARATISAQRRKAVLSGLSSLGYAIGAELLTATPAAGRIVVRRPDQPAYGVELMVPEGADRLQVKVVAISGPTAPRDASRDRDAETAWCTDFSKLQMLLQRDGSELIIERALGVGAVPLAEISIADANGSVSEVADRVRWRSLGDDA
jgi:hypothetical protein